MFESEFANEVIWSSEASPPRAFKSRLDPAQVETIQLVYWREHCLECAPPECYSSCELYAERLDRRCVRFDYGIVRNEHVSGLQGFGADLRFRRWAKLETELYGAGLTPLAHGHLGELDAVLSNVVNRVGKLTAGYRPSRWLNRRPYNPQRKSYKAIAKLRESGLSALKVFAPERPCNLFIVECYSFESRPYNLIVDYFDQVMKGRLAIKIEPGQNYYEIPVEQIGAQARELRGKVSVYPENDATVRILFTWLDFVRKKPASAPVAPVALVSPVVAPCAAPAEKIKCLAWDLDGTLWTGVLIEEGKEGVKIRPEALATIKELDRRGIIHTIVSKNDFDLAWALVGELGLQSYFIHPAINWGPKSANMLEVARKINIGIDSIALVDDSPFERAEVSETLPAVRVYRDTDIAGLASLPEFDVPITEMSALRRQTYLEEMERDHIREAHGEDYETFLKSCRMELCIFVPIEQRHRDRCWELLQRSNQLNLSSRRYTRVEFEALMSKEGHLCVALECSDRFGAYGIIGFASVDEAREEPELVDFAMSCRVAQKMVEHAFFQWIAAREAQVGKKILRASLNRTKKNSPLVEVFRNLPFKIVDESDSRILMEIAVDEMAGYEPIVRVVAESVSGSRDS